jgi:hypothetical protein
MAKNTKNTPPIYIPNEIRDKLAKRLNIQPLENTDALSSLFNEMYLWSEIGKVLAKTQPEYNGKTGKKGRTKHQNQSQDKDYKRARKIRVRAKQLSKEKPDYKQSDRKIIELLKKEKDPLFSHAEIETLISSVSRGNKIYKGALKEIQKLRIQSFRMDVENIKNRKKWIDEAEPIAAELEEYNKKNSANGGSLALGLFGFDNYANTLRLRLRNPY